MKAVGGAGIVIPAEARQGATAPRAPRNGTRGRLVRGRGVWPRGAAGDEGGGWRRDCHPGGSPTGGCRPPCPPQWPETRNCRAGWGTGWGTYPPSPRPPRGCRRHPQPSCQRLEGGAVERRWVRGGRWRRDYHPGGSRKGGAAPFKPPAKATVSGASLPKHQCVSRGEGHPPLSILSPPHGMRRRGSVLGWTPRGMATAVAAYGRRWTRMRGLGAREERAEASRHRRLKSPEATKAPAEQGWRRPGRNVKQGSVLVQGRGCAV